MIINSLHKLMQYEKYYLILTTHKIQFDLNRSTAIMRTDINLTYVFQRFKKPNKKQFGSH